MIAVVLVFVHLLITISLGIRDATLPESTCSRIISTPNKETEPLIILAGMGGQTTVFINNQLWRLQINDDTCSISPEQSWTPCHDNSVYLNISMKNAPKMDRLEANGKKFACILNFVPKCDFKYLPESNIILEASFPFIRFAKGSSSVRINFSINGTDYNRYIFLAKDARQICSWVGIRLISSDPENTCGNFTVNTEHNTLDYTHEYHRVKEESVTNFVLHAINASVGVTVDWTKEGVSPDVVECEKYGSQVTTTHLTTTSGSCIVGSVFSVIAGIIQWSFE